MFAREIYVRRRERLKAQMESGLVFLPGNQEAPMNYADNPYPFRQDSTFLYYFGLDQPGLAAVLDLDERTECLFGNDPTVEKIVWTGPVPLLRDRCEQVGVAQAAPSNALERVLEKAVGQGRHLHFLPPYRPEHTCPIADCGLRTADSQRRSLPSPDLIRAVVAQRSIKAPEEIEQIEVALSISAQMHTAAMKMARPGVREYEVAGAMEGIALSHGVRTAYPVVFSIHGQIMHNPRHDNVLQAGDIVVNDSAAESPLHYASDVTRTITVGGKFSPRQREIYSIVLQAQARCIAATRPGVEWRQVHRLACVALLEGLKELGLIRGDPEEAVAAGAHTLFFPCGVGHMLGLDVHDMEPLGEEYVGYTDTIRRNPEFGWRSLRLAKAVEPGYVVTVEPGIYFIEPLLDRWRAEGRHRQFIDYDKVGTYRDFGGVRVEDCLLVTEDGCRLLGPPIPKTIAEVEGLAST
jgi:Xaa-Pro aminopeptidase